MKRILVFGATGLAGRQIVAESLKAGHFVIAYIRKDTFHIQHPNLTVFQDSLENEVGIHKAMQGQDVIISAVGNMDLNDSTMIVSPLAKRIIRLIESSQRFICLLGSGSLLNDFKTLRKDLPNQSNMFQYPRSDHWETMMSILPLDIDYTFICPPQIKAGEADSNYNVSSLYFPENSQGFITAGNIGNFIAHEIDNRAFLRTRVGIATKA